MTYLSLALAVLAPLVVVWSFSGSGYLVALGAYTALAAFALAAWNCFRRGDRSTAARTAVVIAGVALLLGLATLAFGIVIMGLPTLWFSGTG